MQGLGLRPAEFWALTPVELRLMLGEREGVRPMARDGLEALLRAFPDEQGEMSDG